jgi:tRNA A37 threonylcarbamoyladenosine synthetase subunit TsaC/SUA5/YrdC
MGSEGKGGGRTDDPLPRPELEARCARVLDTLEEGGVAILPLDVAYAVIAQREDGIRRIFAAKRRSYDKPSGMFGDCGLSREIHLMDRDRHEMVRIVVEEERLPFSVVAPYRRDHPIFARVEPFVLASSSKQGTLDMLLNAGQFHDEIARQSRERGLPVFGSSANTSLAGSKYRYADIEPEVREAADIFIEHGQSRYANDEGRSSTIIDFADFTVVRVGVCFDRLVAAFKDRFDVELAITERTAR